ncbi:MAG: 3'(2'),5'-bisphosphate nucleotidase CysQ [Bacteroidetes bacterium]|nr:3'(2'),5'-bisphosphate nucleotidase CysQ [Bacteroidota bacterium]
MSVKININEIIKLAIKAGEAIMEVYEDETAFVNVDFKADNSPLTIADTISNNIIVEELQRLYPEIPVISEEIEAMPYAQRKDWKTFWLVDPLDGTKEFIKRNGEFTVNIALIKDGMASLGVIYVPVKNEVYFGEVGKGAFKNVDGADEALTGHCLSSVKTAVGSRSHESPEEIQVLERFSVQNKISVGSSLKFCLLAEGKAHVYFRFGPTMEWDVAAGHAILRAAGGEVFKGDSTTEIFTYNKPDLRNGSFLCVGRDYFKNN